eukprot:1359483-Pyramimonas_sp.AAC.1
MDRWIGGFMTFACSRCAAHFPDLKVHELGPDLMTYIYTGIANDDLNATRTCAAFLKGNMVSTYVSPTGPTSGECLSPLQL